MTSLPRLVLRLLGGFALEYNAQPVELSYEKGRALLAYLALEQGHRHGRKSLAAMFWPDLEQCAALSNLRQVLHDLRKALDIEHTTQPLLQVDREFVRLDLAGRLDVDTAEFLAFSPACAATPSKEHCGPCLGHIANLVAGYRGKFMADFSLPACPDFEEWLLNQRETLHLNALGWLARLSECHAHLGDYDKSLPFALRFLKLAPDSEQGLQRVMRLLVLTGQEDSALVCYTASCSYLQRELGISPSAETQNLAERIRRGELSPVARDELFAHSFVPLAQPCAQRRQVTVFCCELTPVSEEDPDTVLALLSQPQAHCEEIVRGYGGFIVPIHGGSLLAYFGYPLASENAARQAARAALAVSSAVGGGIAIHAGIHAGMVISGGDFQLPDAVGVVSGFAARLRQVAGSGEVIVSTALHEVLNGYFECCSLGRRQLPGSTDMQEIFRLGRETGALSRLGAAIQLTPLVGRTDEIALLLSDWRNACCGKRCIVSLQGEAGMGKSRLVLALKLAIDQEAHAIRELHCCAEFSHSPFHPVSVLFTEWLALGVCDTPAMRFNKLADYVEKHYPKREHDIVPLLAQMLMLPLRDPYRKLTSSPEQQREQMLTLLIDIVDVLAELKPLLLVVEDLHWADPSTIELFQRWVERKSTVPVMAIFTARPGLMPLWRGKLTRSLVLKPLSEAQTAKLIAAVATEIMPEKVEQIVARADGIPLFAEELARQVVVNACAPVPATLQDLLAARLDALGAMKVIAQAAATIGRDFDFDLLSSLLSFDRDTLMRMLRQLCDAGILWRTEAGNWQFRHALFRDAAYLAQTREECQTMHRCIAVALAAAPSSSRPERLAQHWAAAGVVSSAITCWIEAGKLASRQSASQEALNHFRAAMSLLGALPENVDRLSIELELQIGLGSAAVAVQGYASDEGARAYARAIFLAAQSDGEPAMFSAVWGLWASASSRAGYADARQLAEKLLGMSTQSADPLHLQQSHFAYGNTLFWQGEFAAALLHLETVGVLYNPEHHVGHVASFGEDAGVTAEAYRSWVLWFLGFPDQARLASARSVALARQLDHPFSLAYALTFAAILHCRLRDPEVSLALAQETLIVSESHGYKLWQIGASLARGWALTQQGDEAGVEAIRQCIDATRMAMGGVSLVVLEPLVDVCVLLGRQEEALDAIKEASEIARVLGDQHIDAELQRYKGEILLGMPGNHDEQAEKCFQLAIDISRRQLAKTLELRAAIGLARFWLRIGRRTSARHLLQDILNGFSEGLSTADLGDAGALLAMLSA